MSDRLQEIRERVEAATRGPWSVAPRKYTNPFEMEYEPVTASIDIVDPDGNLLAYLDAHDYDCDRFYANAELFARVRGDIPFLLAEIDRLQNRRCETCRHWCLVYTSNNKELPYCAEVDSFADKDFFCGWWEVTT